MLRPIIGLAALAALAAPLAAQDEKAKPTGSGEDLVDLTRRIDLRVEVAGAEDEEEWTYTLRHDHRVKLGDGWQANLRVDLPFKSLPDEAGGRDFGGGDMLLNAGFVRRLENGEGFGFGAQLIVPTGELGREQWRLRPGAGYRWPAHSISEHSFFQLQVRYDFSFAGDDDRPDTRELQFSPTLEIGLPDKAYVSIYPSTDMRYDFERDEVFIPFDVEVGKEWGAWVASVEGSVGLVTEEHAPYDWKVEARLGRNF